MKIWQIKEIAPSTFDTFSDKLKLKMIMCQFAFPIEHHDEIRLWLIENMNYPYLIDRLTVKKEKHNHVWVQFTNEEDAMAFKLKWS